VSGWWFPFGQRAYLPERHRPHAREQPPSTESPPPCGGGNGVRFRGGLPALQRVQESYDAFEAAERRPVVDHGDNYVAFALNGADWHALFEFIERQIDDEEMKAYIAQVATKLMSVITGGGWPSYRIEENT